MQLSKYQRIILSDVQNPRYENHRRWMWGIYGLLSVALIAIHFIFFQPSMIRNAKIIYSLYRASIVSTNNEFKMMVFIYQYVLAFALFLMFVAIFACVGFFAFDLQQRNSLIQKLQRRNTADASEKEIS